MGTNEEMFIVDASGQIRFKDIATGDRQELDLITLARQNWQFRMADKHNKPHEGEFYEARI